MASPSVLISLRIEEDLLADIDNMIEEGNARSRSQFIRQSIIDNLDNKSAPSVPGVRPVTIEFGSEMWYLFDLIHQRLGYNPSQVIKIAVDDWTSSELEKRRAMVEGWENLRRPGYDGHDEKPTT